MKKYLLLLLLLASNAIQSQSLGGFLNACDFYKEPFYKHFEKCAEAKHQYYACRKVRWPLTYPGDYFSMYVPSFFIEVTPHFGKSKFASDSVLSGSLLKAHLEGAKDFWESTNRFAFPMSEKLQGGTDIGDDMYAYYARIIEIPFGSFGGGPGVLSFPSWISGNDDLIKSRSAGIGVPICFEAISENFEAQWRKNQIDGPISQATHRLRWELCGSLTGLAAAEVQKYAADVAKTYAKSVVSNAGNIEIGSVGQCSIPHTGEMLKVKMAGASKDTFSYLFNPLNYCFGGLGPKLPRTRYVYGPDPHTAALITALKFASLAGDVIDPTLRVSGNGYKIQQLYPKPLASSSMPGLPGEAPCHRPWMLKELRPDRLLQKFRLSTSDIDQRRKETPGEDTGTYVFAVWQYKKKCIDPNLGWMALFKAQLAANSSICKATK